MSTPLRSLRATMLVSSAVIVITAAARNAGAACGNEVPLTMLGSGPGEVLLCDDTRGVAALAWAQAAPLGTDSGLVPIVCEQSGTRCAGGGTLGDGQVTVESDWSRSGMEGCPPSQPPARIGLALQASDGAGLIVLLTRDRLGAGTGYLVTGALPFDLAAGEVAPLGCGPGAGRPEVLGVTPGPPGSIQVALQVPAPVLHSDCDPDSVGVVFAGPCGSPPAAPPVRGPIYVRTGACSTRPDLRRGMWTATGVQPDDQGGAVVTAAAPSPGECLYIGSTTMIDAVESGAITGYARLPGGPCVDEDGDGVTGCDGDCDDGDPERAPDHAEICDLRDNDCDGRIDEDLDCPATCAAPVKNGGDVRVTAAPGPSTSPAIVFNGAGYGIVWSDTRDGQNGIYFNRLGPSGAPLSPEMRLGPPGSMASLPALVWNGITYGLIWTDRRSGSPEIYFMLLAADGAPASVPVDVTPGMFSDTASLVATADGFAVAWKSDYALVGGDDIFFRHLDLSGAPSGPVRQVTDNPAVEMGPSLGWDGTNFAVVWSDARVAGNPEIFAALLDADGSRIRDDIRVSNAPGTSEDPNVAAADAGFVVAWTDWRSGHREVFAARITADGPPRSETQVTSVDAFDSSEASLAWSGAEIRVAWTDGRNGGRDIFFAPLDAFGLRLGPELPLVSHFSHTSSSPSMTAAGSGTGVAWVDHRDGDFEIYVTRVGCHCVDADGDGWSACAECDDTRADVNPGMVEHCDGVDENCNGVVDDDAQGTDSDADGVVNACDNCRFDANPDQADLDHDGVGDLCDLSDGLIMVRMRADTFLEWQMEAGFWSFDVYRGGIPGLVDPDGDGAASSYGTCLAPGLAGPAYGDAAIPAPGTAFEYLVTGRGPGGESSLGVASSGAPRPNTGPCP